MLDRAEVFGGEELEELNWSEIWESGIVEDHASELTSDTSDTYYSDKLTFFFILLNFWHFTIFLLQTGQVQDRS